MKTYRNTLHTGDCLDIMRLIPTSTIDACYLDPPYNTGRPFSKDNGGYADAWKYSDCPNGPNWITDIYGKTGTTAHLNYLAERLTEIHRILKPTGSLFLHVDHRTSGPLRVLLDNLFGPHNFRNLIIWHYSTHPNLYPQRAFYSASDHILFYARDRANTFNAVYKPLTHASIIENYPYTDPRGRRYRNAGEFIDNTHREYADESPGTPINALWDIKIARPKERTGYPTQKPLALLKRIITCSTNPGDLVLDPFCGSGTTCLAADRLDRHYIGIDLNEIAIETTRQRLARPALTWKTNEDLK